jgi:hypothetical protein
MLLFISSLTQDSLLALYCPIWFTISLHMFNLTLLSDGSADRLG